MNSRIRPLDPKVIAQIAAGEVVERPASVVKELVENSLDAGATQIKISLQQAGLDSLIVEDNGHGLAPEDLPLALEPHTTSKIVSLGDLEEGMTLGFRGEALHSMTSVAEVMIASRPTKKSEAIEYSASSKQTLPVGIPIGTRLTVNNLFSNVPARKKFLRSTQQELRKSIEVIEKLALSHPAVGFRLLNNNKQLIDLPPNQALEERFLSVTQLKSTDLIPIEYHFTHFNFTGFLGIPQVASSAKHHHYVIVNNRPLEMPPISKRIKQAYGRLLEPRSYPIFLLNLNVPPTLVDTNVHPRKEEVRFIQSETIYSLIDQVVTETLKKFHDQTQYELINATGLSLADGQSRQGNSQLADLFKENITIWKPKSTEVKEVLQIAYTYLLVVTERELLLFDQHAVHERILFEQLSSAYKNTKVKIKSITAQPLPLSVQEVELIKEHLKTLATVGFQIEEEKERLVLVTIPQELDEAKSVTTLKEILQDLAEERPLKDMYSLAERTLAYLSCHSAIQAGEYLAPEQRLALIQKLMDTPNFSTCPHGRPTMVKISTQDLEKLFKRTGGSSFR